ncbi:MAG: lactonase family protein [Acidobacteriota bacterium]
MSGGSPNPPGGGGNPSPAPGAPPQTAEYLYVGAYPYIDTFQMNTTTGIPGAAAQLQTHGAESIVVTNPAQFLYASEWQNSTSINAFSIGAGGALTILSGSPYTLPAQNLNSGIAAMALTPDNSTLYVLRSIPAAIVAFHVDSQTGALTLLSNSISFSQAIDRGELTVDPTGHFLYAALSATNQSYAAIGVYSIAPDTKALSAISSSPYPQPANAGLSSMVLDPTGRFLYLTNATTGQLLGYTVDATTGGLTPMPGMPLNTPSVYTSSIALNPSGNMLYALGSQEIAIYSIDSSSGVPAMTLEWTPPANAYCVVAPPIVIDPTGFYAYTANGTGLCIFEIIQANGQLTLLTPSGFNAPNGDGNAKIAIVKAP